MSNNRNNSKKEIKLSELTNIIQELLEKNKQYEDNIESLNARVFGVTKFNYIEDVTYGNLSDEVERLSTVVKSMIYNNEKEYVSNSRGKRFDNNGYIAKIKKRASNKKKNNEEKLKKNNEKEPTWQSNY